MFGLSQSHLLTALVISLLLSQGCGDASDVTPASDSSTKKDSALTETKLADKPEVAKANPKRDKMAEVQVARKYTPPFPNRINPFQPPMNAPRLRANSNENRNSSVTLVGFANVGEPKVVLAIDGIVSPMSNGEKLAGVQVISIAPPNAVLQRGRNRWTATLE